MPLVSGGRMMPFVATRTSTSGRLLGEYGEPRMTRFLASELALDHYYDISRAKRDFGYAPQFSMDAALERTLPFLR